MKYEELPPVPDTWGLTEIILASIWCALVIWLLIHVWLPIIR
jgi:hypothetical protein